MVEVSRDALVPARRGMTGLAGVLELPGMGIAVARCACRKRKPNEFHGRSMVELIPVAFVAGHGDVLSREPEPGSRMIELRHRHPAIE